MLQRVADSRVGRGWSHFVVMKGFMAEITRLRLRPLPRLVVVSADLTSSDSLEITIISINEVLLFIIGVQKRSSNSPSFFRPRWAIHCNVFFV